MKVTLWAIEILTLFFIIHQSGITIASWFFGSRKNGVYPTEPVTRFICLVCAHNEAGVVAQIVKSLQRQNYPSHLYDVRVIADNCNDGTEQEVLSAGGEPWIRHDETKKSKGYALEWAFNRIFKHHEDDYDFVCIFDADNLISPNFLAEMDKEAQRGVEVMQGYLDSKNPKDTWITKSYAFSYWATNRVFQLARQVLGLSAQLGGTGMAISLKVLKEHPWGTQSMTEDLEYVARYVISSGKPVSWVHNAKVYDEKPLKMKASFVQRTRWARGHIDCAIKYSGQLLRRIGKAIKERDLKSALIAWDVLIYLVQPSRIILSTITIMAFITSIIFPGFGIGRTPYLWLLVVVVYYGLPMIGLLQEKQGKSVLWSVQVYAFALSWIPIFFIALFTRKKKTWNKTVHTRVVEMDEIEVSA